jgi:hypothetical protein
MMTAKRFSPRAEVLRRSKDQHLTSSLGNDLNQPDSLLIDLIAESSITP